MATTAPAIPAVGSKAPGFKLPSSEGKEISLDALSEKRSVVLYFYPRADTPGCTKEACGFRDSIDDYHKLNAAVVGISPDPVEAVEKFARKYTLPFPLLADADHAVSEKYGVWQEKNNYGKKYWGVARTTFIIREGRIAHVFKNVKADGHEQQVLEWLRTN